MELQGFDAHHGIAKVTFEQVNLHVRLLVAADIQPNEFVRQITVKP